MNVPGWVSAVWSPRVPAAKPSFAKTLVYDVGWWSLAMVFTVPAMLFGFGDGGTGWLPPIAAGFGYAVALTVRRFVPMAALLTVVVLGVWTGFESAGPQPSSWAPVVIFALLGLAYLVGRMDDGRQPMLLQVGASIVLVLLLAPFFDADLTQAAMLTVFLVFFVVFPWLFGRYRYQNAELATSGWQRAEQLEREQRAVAEQARLRERTRIAEDMHDSLGHELSLIALRAAALEVDRELPDRHQASAGQLRRSAAAATERLREIIGLLRDDGEQASVTPVDESLTELVDRARESGMDVTLQLDSGAPRLPRMADRAAHRVVQESLTNAAKHAPGSAVTIVVEAADDYTISVTNGLPDDDQPAGVSGGRGLVGLTERVRLAGGTLQSGPSASRFEVVARLPYSQDEAVPVESVVATESVRQHVQVRTQARRRLLAVFVLPAIMLAVLGIGSSAFFFVVDNNSDMTAEQFRQLHEGQTRQEAGELLPPFETLDPPSELGLTGLPEGATCEYYSDPSDFYGMPDVYEVCFMDEILIDKSVITSEERLNR